VQGLLLGAFLVLLCAVVFRVWDMFVALVVKVDVCRMK
jgi:hypothetical protein